MVALVEPTTRLGTLWQSRRILQLLISRDLKVKYAQTIFGPLCGVNSSAKTPSVWMLFCAVSRSIRRVASFSRSITGTRTVSRRSARC